MDEKQVDVDNLIMQNGQLRGAIRNLKRELKWERQEKERYRKMVKVDSKKHYRNNRRRVQR